MIPLFSWLIVFSGLLYLIGILVVPFLKAQLVPHIILLSFMVGIASAIGLIVVLVKERKKDKKEEDKDDLGKY